MNRWKDLERGRISYFSTPAFVGITEKNHDSRNAGTSLNTSWSQHETARRNSYHQHQLMMNSWYDNHTTQQLHSAPSPELLQLGSLLVTDLLDILKRADAGYEPCWEGTH